MTEQRVRMRTCRVTNDPVLTRTNVLRQTSPICVKRATGQMQRVRSSPVGRVHIRVHQEKKKGSQKCSAEFDSRRRPAFSHYDAASIPTCGRTIKTNEEPQMMMTSHLPLITLDSLDCWECVLFQSFLPSWDFCTHSARLQEEVL